MQITARTASSQSFGISEHVLSACNGMTGQYKEQPRRKGERVRREGSTDTPRRIFDVFGSLLGIDRTKHKVKRSPTLTRSSTPARVEKASLGEKECREGESQEQGPSADWPAKGCADVWTVRQLHHSTQPFWEYLARLNNSSNSVPPTTSLSNRQHVQISTLRSRKTSEASRTMCVPTCPRTLFHPPRRDRRWCWVADCCAPFLFDVKSNSDKLRPAARFAGAENHMQKDICWIYLISICDANRCTPPPIHLEPAPQAR